MADLTPQQVASANCAYWAILNKIKLANGNTFSFEDREYQREPMESKAPCICYMKATGGGFSEIEILKTLHGMIHNRYRQGVLYMFPTNDDVQDFSKSRFNPLILYNYKAIGQYVKTVGKGVDSAKLKRVGESNLYLRGARLDPSDTGGDAKKSTKLTGIQVDRIVPDEIDQMDSEAIAKARGRMGSAAVDGIKGNREEAYIANPSDEDRGIDLYWQESDQRQWFRACQECGTETCAELEFQSNPEKCIDLYDNGKGFIKCKKCGRPLGIFPGRWIPQAPINTEKLVGYQWSHLTSAYHDPAVLLDRFNNPPEGNLGDVIRLDFGLPYSSREDKLRKHDVLACCGREIPPTYHTGPCAAGVDVLPGGKKQVIIGTRTGIDEYEIIKTAKIEGDTDWLKLGDMFKKYGVKSAVIDLRPDEDAAREFEKKMHSKTRIYLCEYTESPLIDANYNEATRIVKVYRTGIFDQTHRLVLAQKFLLPRQSADMDEFARQVCNCVKKRHEDKRSGKIYYIYEKTGNKQDHFRNALNYFLLAARGGKVSRVGATKARQTQADNSFARI
jgi:hypothetical protein